MFLMVFLGQNHELEGIISHFFWFSRRTCHVFMQFFRTISLPLVLQFVAGNAGCDVGKPSAAPATIKPVTCSHHLQKWGFLLNGPTGPSINRLSPPVRRFSVYGFLCAFAHRSLFQQPSAFLPDILRRVDVPVMELQTVVTEPDPHIQILYLRMDAPAARA